MVGNQELSLGLQIEAASWCQIEDSSWVADRRKLDRSFPLDGRQDIPLGLQIEDSLRVAGRRFLLGGTCNKLC